MNYFFSGIENLRKCITQRNVFSVALLLKNLMNVFSKALPLKKKLFEK